MRLYVSDIKKGLVKTNLPVLFIFNIMNYGREINRVLAEAGDKGLSMKKITMHVYNHVNGLFCSVDFEDVRREVVNYVNRTVRQNNSFIERTGERGVYRLNKSFDNEYQLKFDFKDFVEPEDNENRSDMDKSLSLFND